MRQAEGNRLESDRAHLGPGVAGGQRSAAEPCAARPSGGLAGAKQGVGGGGVIRRFGGLAGARRLHQGRRAVSWQAALRMSDAATPDL